MAITGIKAVLLDLDGVLYIGEEAVPGAPAAVEALRSAGIGLRFVTNTTVRSHPQTVDKLRGLGFDVAPEEVVTPAAGLTARLGRRVALIMNDALREDFEGLEEVEEAPDAVIMGDLGERFGFTILDRAFRMVMEGAELIALQKNRFWLTATGLSLDAGPFVAAIEYATDRDAYVVGKPSQRFFELVLGSLGVDAAGAAMVGDDVEADVDGATRAGLAGVLVRTGKYREEFLQRSGIEPTATVDSIADVPALLRLSEGQAESPSS